MRFRNRGVLAPSETPNSVLPKQIRVTDDRWLVRSALAPRPVKTPAVCSRFLRCMVISEPSISGGSVEANPTSVSETPLKSSRELWKTYLGKANRSMKITLASAGVWLAMEGLQKLNLRLGVITNQGVDVSLSFFLTLVPPVYFAYFVSCRNPEPPELKRSNKTLNTLNLLRFNSLFIVVAGFLTEISQRRPDPLDVVAFTLGAESALVMQEFLLTRPLAAFSRSFQTN